MKRRSIFGLIFLIFLSLAINVYRTRGVEVRLINDGPGPIKKVKIEFTGGAKVITQISTRSEYKTHINPKGESGLKLEFVDSNGLSHRQFVDVYFERNYRGKIIIKIDSAGNVSWVDDMKIGII